MKTMHLLRSVLAAGALLLAAAAPAAETPKLLPFQGRLTDAAGQPVSNGVRLVQFRIYNQPSGGTPVWAGEIHRTTVNGGLVNVALGSRTPLEGVDFNQQLYLEITVDINGDNSVTAADPPMLPRQSILPTVYALEAGNARKLGGYDWSVVMSNGADPGNPTNYLRGAKLEPASVTLDRLAAEVADRLVPVGTIVAYAGPNVPPGWLACDGSWADRAAYARLFAAIGTSWGAADFSSYFNIPDLRGQFLRGDAMGSGADPDVFSRYAGYSGGNGIGVGSYQWFGTARPASSAFVTGTESHHHNHNYYDGFYAEANFASPGNEGLPGSSHGVDYDNGAYGINRTSGVQNQLHYHTITGGGDVETRPRNVSVLYIIKY